MTLLRTVKNSIRRCRTPDQPARAVDVKELLAQHDEHEGEALLESYQRAKRHGEIYEYPTNGTEVVKITDEVIA